LNPEAAAADQLEAATGGRFLWRRPVAITLQSSVGGFSSDFLRKLPLVEHDMVEHGLEPDAFLISKDRATPSSLYVTGAFFFEYTVYVDGENFTVTEPNDMTFLEFFHKRCIAEEEKETPLPTLQRRPPGPIRRFLSWMAQPI
jgi:hypothetical protein